MIWDGLAEMWQEVNREAKATRAVREAKDKTEFVEITIVKIKTKFISSIYIVNQLWLAGARLRSHGIRTNNYNFLFNKLIKFRIISISPNADFIFRLHNSSLIKQRSILRANIWLIRK